jgi:hypothetical protein
MSECVITATYTYAQSDRDYPSGMPEEQRIAADLARAPDIMARAIEAGQVIFRVEVAP